MHGQPGFLAFNVSELALTSLNLVHIYCKGLLASSWDIILCRSLSYFVVTLVYNSFVRCCHHL